MGDRRELQMKRIVKEIEKRKDVVIRIGREELGGHEYGEIRQYIRDSYGSLKPTQKGLTFNTDILDEIIKGLLELKKSLCPDKKR